jgi:Tfp pilus assembly protein PilF
MLSVALVVSVLLTGCGHSTMASSGSSGTSAGAGAQTEAEATWRRQLEAGKAAVGEGRLNDAESSLNDAVKTAESFGPDDPRLGITLSNLAVLYLDEGRLDDAREPLDRALKILAQQRNGENASLRMSYVQTLAIAGEIALKTEHYDDAEHDYREALSVLDTLPNASAVSVVRGNVGLAEALCLSGQTTAADAAHRRVMALIDHVDARDAGVLGQVLNDYGTALIVCRQYPEAVAVLDRAVATSTQAFGPNDRRVGVALGNLATARMDAGDDKAAEELFKRALAILDKPNEPPSGDLFVCLNNYAVLLRKTNRVSEAERLEARIPVTPAGKSTPPAQ